MRARTLLVEGGLAGVAALVSSVAVTALWSLWKTGFMVPDWETSLALAVGLAVALPLAHQFRAQRS